MFIRLALLLLFSFGLTPAHADWYPPLKSAMPIPDLQVFDESGETGGVRSLLEHMGTGPVVLLPVFTKCKMTCPVMVQALKRAAAEFEKAEPMHFQIRIAVLSFDATDTEADLRAFRKRETVSPRWKIFGVKSQTGAREFFDHYSYAIMTDGGGFNHPTQALALSTGLKWVGSVYGANIGGEDIARAYHRAIDLESTGALASAKNYLALPETFVILGAAGLLFWIVALFRIAKGLRIPARFSSLPRSYAGIEGATPSKSASKSSR